MKNSIYDQIFTEQGKNSADSMPCGGCDTGAVVWTENNEVLFYLDRSGNFDENGQMLKFGRFRISFSEEVFYGQFEQKLNLLTGAVTVTGRDVFLKLWFDANKPIGTIEIVTKRPISVQCAFETWRFQNQKGCPASYGFNGYLKDRTTYKDTVKFQNGVVFYHKNKSTGTIFDFCIKQQLFKKPEGLYNPINGRIFGGILTGKHVSHTKRGEGEYASIPFQSYVLVTDESTEHEFRIHLLSKQGESAKEYEKELQSLRNIAPDWKKTLQFWKKISNESYLYIDSKKDTVGSMIAKNYALIRYMLGCNAKGEFPTKFNGGLFTMDPVYAVGEKYRGLNPDYRAWGGSSFTGQNQRLVYWGMLKSGDFSLMKPQFDFYKNASKAARERTKQYWNHDGVSFTEQLECFGLPAASSWGFKEGEATSEVRTRIPHMDATTQTNPFVKYYFTSQLEFAFMILMYHKYTQKSIKEYLPFIEDSVIFYYEHYKQQYRQNCNKEFDENDKLVITPSTSLETYKNAVNPVDVIAGLLAVTNELILLEEETNKEKFIEIRKHIPNFTIEDNCMKPAQYYHGKINNEMPELYPVFPYRLFQFGQPEILMMQKTFKLLPERARTSTVSWHQECIFAPCIGLKEEAVEAITKKLSDGPLKFPAFFGPGHDWVPDHNWGGSGMIGLQEMIFQEVGDKIYLLPTWREDWELDCKLHLTEKGILWVKFKEGKIHYKISSKKNYQVISSFESYQER